MSASSRFVLKLNSQSGLQLPVQVWDALHYSASLRAFCLPVLQHRSKTCPILTSWAPRSRVDTIYSDSNELFCRQRTCLAGTDRCPGLLYRMFSPDVATNR